MNIFDEQEFSENHTDTFVRCSTKGRHSRERGNLQGLCASKGSLNNGKSHADEKALACGSPVDSRVRENDGIGRVQLYWKIVAKLIFASTKIHP